MKAYGVDRQDRGCCPGYDKFPNETYNNRRSMKAHSLANRIAHKRARARAREDLHDLLKEYSC